MKKILLDVWVQRVALGRKEADPPLGWPDALHKVAFTPCSLLPEVYHEHALPACSEGVNGAWGPFPTSEPHVTTYVCIYANVYLNITYIL